jgi:hypothetical protein
MVLRFVNQPIQLVPLCWAMVDFKQVDVDRDQNARGEYCDTDGVNNIIDREVKMRTKNKTER